MNAVDDFLKDVEPTRRAKLERIRKIALENIPNANEIISYRMPTVRSGDISVLGFYAYEHHIGIYPFSGTVIPEISELKKYKTSKSAVQEPLDAPISEELIVKIIKLRLKQAGISKD